MAVSRLQHALALLEDAGDEGDDGLLSGLTSENADSAQDGPSLDDLVKAREQRQQRQETDDPAAPAAPVGSGLGSDQQTAAGQAEAVTMGDVIEVLLVRALAVLEATTCDQVGNMAGPIPQRTEPLHIPEDLQAAMDNVATSWDAAATLGEEANAPVVTWRFVVRLTQALASALQHEAEALQRRADLAHRTFFLLLRFGVLPYLPPEAAAHFAVRHPVQAAIPGLSLVVGQRTAFLTGFLQHLLNTGGPFAIRMVPDAFVRATLALNVTLAFQPAARRHPHRARHSQRLRRLLEALPVGASIDALLLLVADPAPRPPTSLPLSSTPEEEALRPTWLARAARTLLALQFARPRGVAAACRLLMEEANDSMARDQADRAIMIICTIPKQTMFKPKDYAQAIAAQVLELLQTQPEAARPVVSAALFGMLGNLLQQHLDVLQPTIANALWPTLLLLEKENAKSLLTQNLSDDLKHLHEADALAAELRLWAQLVDLCREPAPFVRLLLPHFDAVAALAFVEQSNKGLAGATKLLGMLLQLGPQDVLAPTCAALLCDKPLMPRAHVTRTLAGEMVIQAGQDLAPNRDDFCNFILAQVRAAHRQRLKLRILAALAERLREHTTSDEDAEGMFRAVAALHALLEDVSADLMRLPEETLQLIEVIIAIPLPDVRAVGLNLLELLLSAQLDQLAPTGVGAQLGNEDPENEAALLAQAQELRQAIVTRAARWSGLGSTPSSTDTPDNAGVHRKLNELAGQLAAPQIPLRAHALVEMRKFLAANPDTAQAHATVLAGLYLSQLKHEDSFLYLPAVNGLADLVAMTPKTMIATLLQEWATKSMSPEYRMKVGEVLVKVCRLLGQRVKDADELVAASALSNLADMCALLRFSLAKYLTEILVLVEDLLQSESEQRRRGALNILVVCLRSLTTDDMTRLAAELRAVRELVARSLALEQDEVARTHAALAQDELDRLRDAYIAPLSTLTPQDLIFRLGNLTPQYVIAAITQALQDGWGNPSSAHGPGRQAKAMIQQARQQVADMVHATRPEQIIFTSGGTEANNWVIQDVVAQSTQRLQSQERPHVITSNVEHDSVKNVLQHLEAQAAIDVTWVPVQSDGRVLVTDVLTAIRSNTCLITLMLANNETGALQPVGEVGAALEDINREREQPVVLHTDAAQAIGKLDVDVAALKVDALTIVGHKFYAPRIGALFVRTRGAPVQENSSNVQTSGSDWYRIRASLYGGGQEAGDRPGTENTPMIVGLGQGAAVVRENLAAHQAHMEAMQNRLYSGLKAFGSEQVHLNGVHEDTPRLCNTLNFSLLNSDLTGADLLAKAGIMASVGSACHSHLGRRPSHVLLASGVPPEIAWAVTPPPRTLTDLSMLYAKLQH
ncbi:uncharacterized protein MONBRDRAFT_25105 [Monosiga brevicollis MX1]|uniref:Selenocysteine lyase n=1 Tax=Monosiga brevicollis TaxID=81824 RepID=A9UYF3_MONBE|nr:uncharacterized protein MONBRDRAFT_25105 [Monosiga brevicollis MX1]EDQ89595.1 predicted protein [Monosiga brevicollis MX1]|eukprot:XP_001745624.1 hypothetical protein [Monosiga brevicollis MX1]